MERFVCTIFLISYSFNVACGIFCHQCQGDPLTCLTSSRVNCRSNDNDAEKDEVCSNQYIKQNGTVSIIKGCAPRSSCSQKDSTLMSHCGNLMEDGQSCRCCCDENFCNDENFDCLGEECAILTAPLHGYINCDTPRILGSKCDFSCRNGFQLIGLNSTKCIKTQKSRQPEWNSIGQQCIPINRCDEMLQEPENGKIKCRNQKKYEDRAEFNYVGSTCLFTCNRGYELSRQSSRVKCNRNGYWSKEAPKCVQLKCPKLSSQANRFHFCSNTHNVGSVCEFLCSPGYKLIGHSTTACSEDITYTKPRWTSEEPTCQLAACRPQLRNPANGAVICTDSNANNSVCTYLCDYGYDLAESDLTTKQVTCRLNINETVGRWSASPASCNRVKCLPQFLNVKNGKVDCTDFNNADSQCKFSCDPGYDLDDTSLQEVISDCFDDQNGDEMGEWTLFPPPTCSRISCEPYYDTLLHGRVDCTHANGLGSVCTFRCDAQYALSNTTNAMVTSTCVKSNVNDNMGIWTTDTPTCIIIKCSTLNRPEHGNISCTDSNNIDSICEFSCDTGFELFGNHVIACKDAKRDGDRLAEWTSELPTCRRTYCPHQEYDITTLIQKCEFSNAIFGVPTGTTCSYSCRHIGHFLVIQHDNEDKDLHFITCSHSKRWSEDAPRCSPISCDPFTLPDNGSEIVCSKGNHHGSKCNLSCHVSHKVSDSTPVTCISDGTDRDGKGVWDRELPHCILNE